MEKLNKVEIVREKTGVNYEDARRALEQTDYDVLDAIVLLEQQGKAETQTAYHVTSSEPQEVSTEMQRAQQEYEQSSKKTRAGDVVDRLVETAKRLCSRGLEVSFVVERNDAQILALPVLILVILILFLFPATIPLLIVGLFFGFRYHFEGLADASVNINDAMGKAADQAVSFKNDVIGDNN